MSNYLSFNQTYKDSIILNESQFETLCKYQNSTEDPKALEIIKNHLISKQQKPMNLNSPRAVYEQPIERIRISKPKPIITKSVNMAMCIKEIESNNLFLRMKARCEVSQPNFITQPIELVQTIELVI